MKTYRTEWRWGFAAAFAVMVLAMFPQVWFLLDRGREWHGANAIMHPDEVAYSNYIAALIRGAPRRNDPYTGREDKQDGAAPESLFSIQVVPAYAAAAPARVLGLTAANVFMIFPTLFAGASALAIFWLISLLTRDGRLSAAAVLVILNFGTLIARQGILRYVPNLDFLIPQWLSLMILPPSVYHLPFIRFYQPAVAFPIFFTLCAFIWTALTAQSKRLVLTAAIAAGLSFAVLVFSYFYLWTAAAAWLAFIFMLWMFARREEGRRTLMIFGIVGVIAVPALAGYFLLLSQRVSTTDDAQALVLTREPDLFRLSEIVALAVLVLLFAGVRRGIFPGRDRVVLFTASLALTVFAVFNQQIITGRSLQPIHYEWFIGNYCALAAIVFTASLWLRWDRRQVLTNKRLAIIAGLAFIWGSCEVWLAASLNLEHNRRVNEVQPVASRLSGLAGVDGALRSVRTGEARPVVLMADLRLADRLPTDAPQAVLWAPRMLVFPGVTEPEFRERFFQQLYYLGYDKQKLFNEFDRADWDFYAGMFSYYRLSPVISGSTSPITPEEMRAQVQSFLAYSQGFNRERATEPTLSYLILYADDEPDYSNLDQWYERDAGERIGRFLVYQLKLRE